VLGETISHGFDKLGWHWWVSDNAIVSREYDGRPGCELHGKCMFGCPMGSKASTDLTYWPKALRKGAVLRTWARVREISVDAKGGASGAVYYDRQGNLHEQPARVVVVCCNGIGTPRLLLNSKSKLFPQGLANSHGVVGRNFMMHPFRMLEGVFEAEMNGYEDPLGFLLSASNSMKPTHSGVLCVATPSCWNGVLARCITPGAAFRISRCLGVPSTIG